MSTYSPTHILWQQGETDARKMPAHEYRKALSEVLGTARSAFPKARIHAAISTRCHGEPDKAIQAAQQIFPGPNTDAITDRIDDGCHFSKAGQERAADLWFAAIRN